MPVLLKVEEIINTHFCCLVWPKLNLPVTLLSQNIVTKFVMRGAEVNYERETRKNSKKSNVVTFFAL